MTPKEVAIKRTRTHYAGGYVDRTALAAPTDREAAAQLSSILRGGGAGGRGVHITHTATHVEYSIHGHDGQLTYLDLACEIRRSGRQLSLLDPTP